MPIPEDKMNWLRGHKRFLIGDDIGVLNDCTCPECGHTLFWRAPGDRYQCSNCEVLYRFNGGVLIKEEDLFGETSVGLWSDGKDFPKGYA